MAAKVSLHTTTTATASTNSASSELKALDAERQRLEGAIQDLKYRKATIPEAEYSRQMETLLIQLAQTNQKVNAAKKK
jgi:HPt (histidine-containing phosphotransfer) domain-containing protein